MDNQMCPVTLCRRVIESIGSTEGSKKRGGVQIFDPAPGGTWMTRTVLLIHRHYNHRLWESYLICRRRYFSWYWFCSCSDNEATCHSCKWAI